MTAGTGIRLAPLEPGMELPDLSGRTVLVTGATSGVGQDGAIRLGARGARVLVHGRDAERGRATVDAVEDAGGTASFHPADFTDLEAVRTLADAVRAETDELDVLCNNAGLYTSYRGRTEQGFGTIFGVNHVAPYVLTHELADHLAADARVVNTASVAHRFAQLDLDMVERKRGLTGPAVERYCESKLCNVLFTRELARRLGPATANCFHPGNIPESNFTRDLPFPLSLGADALSALPAIPGVTDSVEDGGRALAYLAAASEVEGVTGEYFDKRELTDPARTAKNDALARLLWDLTADLANVDPELPAGPATRDADAEGRASRGVRIDVTDAADGSRETDTGAESTAVADAGSAAADDGPVEVEVTEAGDDAPGTAPDDDASGTADRALTDLDGVGPTTAEALRAAGFESVADVRAASVADLTAADGVGPAKAQRIRADTDEE
ncbi:SDR family NAD(P)-dependent oxidoreductase [Haloglomus litoreum]|uniref:SDR family NAD(P)-dependent oxidoreductase n=1 Tax=Haloglomus litoreum TaxID=3034026 RepID=UPI0023E875B1|nr:SDR family NAD(P)-dependent oxidoreductase [Haloglomus sp. DT116]